MNSFCLHRGEKYIAQMELNNVKQSMKCKVLMKPNEVSLEVGMRWTGKMCHETETFSMTTRSITIYSQTHPPHYCCSVTKLCLILCGPMDYSTPGSSVFHYLPVCSNSHPLTQWCLTISSSAAPFSFWLQSFPTLRTFPMSWFFTSGDQIIGASASASLLPMNI